MTEIKCVNCGKTLTTGELNESNWDLVKLGIEPTHYCGDCADWFDFQDTGKLI